MCSAYALFANACFAEKIAYFESCSSFNLRFISSVYGFITRILARQHDYVFASMRGQALVLEGCMTRFETLKLKYKKEKAKMDENEGYSGESEVDEDEEEDEEDEDEDEEVDEVGFKLLAESVQNFHEIYKKIEGRKRQQIMELDKMRMDFQRELELQKVILIRAPAEIARIMEEDDEDANSVENLSG
ncbi:hypothetical protein Tco_0172762 [Tanacetum coccineum]